MIVCIETFYVQKLKLLCSQISNTLYRVINKSYWEVESLQYHSYLANEVSSAVSPARSLVIILLWLVIFVMKLTKSFRRSLVSEFDWKVYSAVPTYVHGAVSNLTFAPIHEGKVFSRTTCHKYLLDSFRRRYRDRIVQNWSNSSLQCCSLFRVPVCDTTVFESLRIICRYRCRSSTLPSFYLHLELPVYEL